MTKYLYKNKWVSLKQTSKGFVYGERRNVNSTASLLFKKENNNYKFLLRYQPLPELKLIDTNKMKWSTLYPCCVTGSMEKNEIPIDNVIKEVLEETNYIVSKKDIKDFNIVVSSTQMNECVYNFIIDITNAKRLNKKEGDGTFFENISKNKWVSHNTLKKILLSDKSIHLSSLASCYLLFDSYINKNKA